MSWNPEKTLVFRLIAAGHMVRRAVQAPLEAFRLKPGDDAILIALSVLPDLTVDDLLAATGLNVAELARRLRHMEALGLVETTQAEVVLTASGTRLAASLMALWQDIDEIVAANVAGPVARNMRKSLKRIAESLAPEVPVAIDPDA
ncbi:MAG: MarR family winged helix-turn-helix transcriptional regulator [Alphaproteobacteria bacterium]|nr:MarR family winged helix-turn-helix transcriptional regulator [Alphaproteobacteria bacterium]